MSRDLTVVALEYIVLRCADLERARAFYGALGLALVAERHGGGPPHYACALGDVVIELYAQTGASSAGARIGLRVPDVGAAVRAAERAGGEVVRLSTAGAAPTALLRDPDGHEVALRS